MEVAHTPEEQSKFENVEQRPYNGSGTINEGSNIESIDLLHQNFDEHLKNVHSSIPREMIPEIGMEFETEEEAFQYYLLYSKKVGFGVRRSKSHNDKSGKLIGRTFCCSAEGKRQRDKRDLNVRAQRPETRFGCDAKMKVNSFKTGKFQVIEFVAEHNHCLPSLSKTHLHRSHRAISSVEARQKMADDVGITPKASFDLMVKQKGGRGNLGFISEDYRNFLRSKRTREMEKGDLGGVLEYLDQMQFKDPNFFQAIQVDIDDLVTNIFWSDAKMRNDYSDFGDVICFDTTYRKNREGRPLALFVGTNHHKQITVFGVALLYDETTETFKWLFDTFARAMSWKKPTTILTDQDKEIADALAFCWPNTHQRLCIRHICQNAAIHLSSVFTKFKAFSGDFSSCVYDFEKEEEFLAAWDNMLQKYELQENDWLKHLFLLKEKWALVYGRQMFCADITTTLKNESLNSTMKKYLSYKHNFSQFFHHFEKLLDDHRYKELRADSRANMSITSLAAPVQMLQHAASLYTPEVFQCFQDQWKMCHDCSFHVCAEDGIVTKYEVTPVGKSYSHMVTYDSLNDEVHCSCWKFEFGGILCSHILKVFTLRNIMSVPGKYIMKRWTRKAKNGYLESKSSHVNETELDPTMESSMRYKDLCALTVRLVTRAAERNDTTKFLKDSLYKALDAIDEMLQSKEVVVEENLMSESEDLCQTSNPEISRCDINLSGRDSIKGVKRKTKSATNKRLKGGLENNARQTESLTGCNTSANVATSASIPIANIQDFEVNIQTTSSMAHPVLSYQLQVSFNIFNTKTSFYLFI
ncbi:OLC1v1031489C1 [Oldenlandia corymbosa var. corymbosa]|uniref:Protein FAR1-RELATED SEQUENCE n=1 Tax=Oldenlandia corymbosa var. corymbosa TaxID=529605 RepID=A0AAV1CLH3_OLDCO|nr:OLC1v1031489C1 [Oldenlandia corymbosa var. corymbosa]